jgi:hypothetical protein
MAALAGDGAAAQWPPPLRAFADAAQAPATGGGCGLRLIKRRRARA